MTAAKPLRPEGLAPYVMTLLEAAAYLGCSRAQVYRQIAAGELRKVKGLGRTPLVTRASVELRLSLMLGETPKERRERVSRRATKESVAAAFRRARERTRSGTQPVRSGGDGRRLSAKSGDGPDDAADGIE